MGGGTYCTVYSMFEKQGEHDLAETETLDKYLLCAPYVNTKWDTALCIFFLRFSPLFHGANPEWFCPDQDPTFQVVPDPDPNL